MKRLCTMVIGVSLAVAFASAPAGAAPADSIVGLPAWDQAPSAGQGSAAGLRGVVSFGPSDVWAVGAAGAPQDRTLAEHWNGSSFSVVPSPNRADRANTLEDVAGVSSNDLWAVGHSDVTNTGAASTLAEHWDGTAWRIVPTPNAAGGSTHNSLTGVAAVATDDAWAVGTASTFRPGLLAITLHWDGSTWTKVRNSCGQGLSDVVAESSSDVWAVGGDHTCHWNGTTWTPLPAAPDFSGFSVQLQDVAIVSSNDVWAVGYALYGCGEGECATGEIQHWTGGAWEFVTHAVPVLYGVDAVAANDVWAVGLGLGPGIEHFDGTDWSQVPSGARIGELFAVSASGADDLWGAGDKGSNTSGALVEQAPSPNSGAVIGRTHVSNAVVSWFGPESGSVTTDPIGGAYQVGGLTAGTYLFTVSYGGCIPDSKRVTVQAGTTIAQDFHLNCGG
ncbi:MAG TPA: carboxypeptidase-like regulatory domain-containing protein [Actinomycetota bacterium]